jgi:hypothetical protein
MTEVTILPPQRAPKQRTANYRPTTLHEHLLAFLNANNPNGFSEEQEGFVMEDIVALDQPTLVDMINKVAEMPRARMSFLAEYAKDLAKLTNNRLGNKAAMRLVARLFGYLNWNEIRIELGPGHVGLKYVYNQRLNGTRKPIPTKVIVETENPTGLKVFNEAERLKFKEALAQQSMEKWVARREKEEVRQGRLVKARGMMKDILQDYTLWQTSDNYDAAKSQEILDAIAAIRSFNDHYTVYKPLSDTNLEQLARIEAAIHNHR